MKVLVAEDESVLANNIKICLEHEESETKRFEVDIAENGIVALRLIQNAYDIVILDLKMPEVDGTQIIEALNMIEPEIRPGVILITAYPGAYETASLTIKMGVQAILQKPFELSQLMQVTRELVKSRRRILASAKQGITLQCQWKLFLAEMGIAFVQVHGLLNFADSCSLPWTHVHALTASNQANVTSALVNATGLLHDYRNFHAKTTGLELFSKLFTGTIEKSFIAAGSIVMHSHDLRLAFVGPRHYLSIPFEFLHDGSEYLILRHPMRRVVTGISFKGSVGISDLLRDLEGRREKLKILLVASNTHPRIDNVDKEVATLYDTLKEQLPSNQFAVEYLPTEEATYNEILARLQGCTYHILHYAGHGHHDERSSDKSCLYFWEKRNCQGSVKPLPVNTLKNTLRQKGHDLKFIYLSCCSGAGTGNEADLLKDNFLGMADGLIVAGVPSVLGFRWPVSDKGAHELALAFYASLFSQGDLDTALFHARCKVQGSEHSQAIEDWLSPILIAQG